MPDDATFIRKSMAFLFSHEEDPLNRTELILQEDSEDDLETRENDSYL